VTELEQQPIRIRNILIGDIWDCLNVKKGRFIVIPTNSQTNANGYAIMGRGIAYQARLHFPKISMLYGNKLTNNKTIKGFYIFKKLGLIMFPTKSKWSESADIHLIKKMLNLLSLAINKYSFIKQITLPMIGCGFGELSYEQVLPYILTLLAMNKKIYLIIPPNHLYGNEKYRESFLPGSTNRKDKRVSLSNNFSDLEF